MQYKQNITKLTVLGFLYNTFTHKNRKSYVILLQL